MSTPPGNDLSIRVKAASQIRITNIDQCDDSACSMGIHLSGVVSKDVLVTYDDAASQLFADTEGAAVHGSVWSADASGRWLDLRLGGVSATQYTKLTTFPFTSSGDLHCGSATWLAYKGITLTGLIC